MGIDELNIENLLKEGVMNFGLPLTDTQVKEFFKYMEILLEWNQKVNLTAIEDEREIVIKHFIDSLSILPYFENKENKLIDVGTGGGFPGIPVKIVFGNVKVTLLDSLEKRVKFLNEAISALKLNGINAVHGRAEDFGAAKEHREKYDISVARAVASLPVLLEYCLPFVKPGGLFIAMKGSSIEEIDSSDKALKILGGENEKIDTLQLTFSEAKRNIVLVRKLRQTPTKYPRKAGKPSKEPLL